MSEDPNDDFSFRPSPRAPQPDSHGQAALLLAESVLHSLIEANVLTVAQAIETVRSACAVKIDVAEETSESDGVAEHSLSLLTAIEDSLMAGSDHMDVSN